MAKGKVIAKVGARAKVKKVPIKAGANRGHGGFPTQKIILITSKIKADIEKRENNG